MKEGWKEAGKEGGETNVVNARCARVDEFRREGRREGGREGGKDKKRSKTYPLIIALCAGQEARQVHIGARYAMSGTGHGGAAGGRENAAEEGTWQGGEREGGREEEAGVSENSPELGRETY